MPCFDVSVEQVVCICTMFRHLVFSVDDFIGQAHLSFALSSEVSGLLTVDVALLIHIVDDLGER